MASEEELGLYNAVIKAGCCKRCALRYLGYDKALTTFSDPDTCLINFGFISPLDDILSEPKSKKPKANPCGVCLGLLDDPTLDQMLTEPSFEKIIGYESKTFVPYITFPTCVLVRDHSMKIHLKRTFPKVFDADKVIKLNNAWRDSVEERLCKILQKTYCRQSKLALHFHTKYILEEDEMQVVKPGQAAMSRHAISNYLEQISDEKFLQLVQCPPKIPLYKLRFTGLNYVSETIHLIGRYCKYSRNLPQASKNQENTIENIVIKALKSVLKDFKEASFHASSFDLAEDRVLGSGRTFHVQIIDPQFSEVRKSLCRKIEEEISSSQVLKVYNLREEQRRNIMAIMDTEKLSPRSFRLLCIVYQCKSIDCCINAVNMCRQITLRQKTPIRLLVHRENRKKNSLIYFIKAKRVENSDNLIEINLSTECGVYIPEFVSGDLGRTEPSLGDLMGAKVDLLAVDVVNFMATAPQTQE